MGKLWDRLIAGFRRLITAPEPPPRRSAWVLVEHLSADPGLQCHFCGRGEGDSAGCLDRQGEGHFALVQARHNPRLQHIVCSDCVKWNRITLA